MSMVAYRISSPDSRYYDARWDGEPDPFALERLLDELNAADDDDGLICDGFPDEPPTVGDDDFYEPTDADLDWWAEQDRQGGWCEASGTPHDLELRTVSALEHHLASFPETD